MALLGLGAAASPRVQHSSPVHFTQLTHRPRGAIKRDKIVLKSDLTLTPLGYNVFDYTRFENHSKNLLFSRMLLCYLPLRTTLTSVDLLNMWASYYAAVRC